MNKLKISDVIKYVEENIGSFHERRFIGASSSKTNIVAINGCCYGIDNKPEKNEYLKLCGQRFWEFISCEENLYTEIIEPLGHKAREKTMNLWKNIRKL